MEIRVYFGCGAMYGLMLTLPLGVIRLPARGYLVTNPTKSQLACLINVPVSLR
jgi:hypothetical protein